MAATGSAALDLNSTFGAAYTAASRAKPRAALTSVVNNLIEAWPAAVYEAPLVEARFLGRKTTFVCAPDLVQSLLVDQAGALERDDFLLRALVPALGRGVLTADGAAWRSQRRTAAPVFRHDRIAAFVPAMSAAAEATAARWRTREASDPIDMLGEMMRATFDVIVATMISDEGGLDVTGFARRVSDYLDQTPWKMGLTLLGAPAWTPHPGWLKGRRSARYMRRTIQSTIEARRQRGDSGQDLLSLLLAAHDPETGAGMSDASLVDNLLTFVAAGHETTALALAWTFSLLAEYPRVADRMREEMNTSRAAAGGTLDLAGLNYTRQVVMEVMRLYPPAPMIARRAARPVMLGTTIVPAGRSIQVPVYAIHRHRALWAAPDMFDPDRFAPAARAARPRHAYLPFGAGPRICIGANFAMTECVAVLAALVPAFTFLRISNERPEARFKITLRPHRGVPLRVVPRDVS